MSPMPDVPACRIRGRLCVGYEGDPLFGALEVVALDIFVRYLNLIFPILFVFAFPYFVIS